MNVTPEILVVRAYRDFYSKSNKERHDVNQVILFNVY
jgi:hypothetical protein